MENKELQQWQHQDDRKSTADWSLFSFRAIKRSEAVSARADEKESVERSSFLVEMMMMIVVVVVVELQTEEEEGDGLFLLFTPKPNTS
ncbi:Hypothetical predicted protein [Scomber scombrus]|uniref:Uncharacterized protein n=1 Tax=Scomber scombrus TaxID=13677 RepID=A0AAV1PEE6_SCOSC